MEDLTRLEAYVRLLALPDEPCLRRGRCYTQARDPRRDPEIIKRDLATAYVAHRRQDHSGDTSRVVSVRRQSLRLIKRA